MMTVRSKIMFTISQNYRRPVFFAVLLHVLLLSIFIFHLSPTQYRYPSASPNHSQPTIHAQAVSASEVQSQVKEIVQAQEAAQQAAQEAVQKKVAAATAAKAAAAKKIEDLKIHQAKLLLQAAAAQKEKAKKLKQAELQKEKLKQEKIQLAKQVAQKKIAMKKKLSAEQAKLQKELMQQQLLQDQHDLTQVQVAANQGVIDQYKAQILSAIQSNWRIQEVNDKLSCVYVVNIAPGGVVLSVVLQKSSGDSGLDQSARDAIFKSSPLPVPTDASEFNSFRRLVLTLSPQGYIQ